MGWKMNNIEWKKEYELGVEEIDNQHKKLVGIVNEFLEAQANHSEEKVIGPIIKELVDYTKVHFESEELHMKKHRYPLLIQHKQEHKALIARIVKILKDLGSGNQDVADDLFQLLKNWLLNHILDKDRQYGNFLKNGKV